MKAVKISNAQKLDMKHEVDNFLLQYRTTPHSTTGVAPSELLMGRKLRDKLPTLPIRPMESDWQQLVRERDEQRKMTSKLYADTKRHAIETEIQIGDKVLLQKSKDNKLSTSFEEQPVKVNGKEGNALKLQTDDGHKMRNVADAKKFQEDDTEYRAIQPWPESITQDTASSVPSSAPRWMQDYIT